MNVALNEAMHRMSGDNARKDTKLKDKYQT